MPEPREIPPPEVLAEIIDAVIADGAVKRWMTITLPDGRTAERIESVAAARG